MTPAVGVTSIATTSPIRVNFVEGARALGGMRDRELEFLYDGEDQLRRVTAPDGTTEEYWNDHTTGGAR